MDSNKYEGCKEYLYKGCTFWYEDYVDILEDRTIVSIYGCEGDVAEYPATIEGYPVVNICKKEGAMNAHDCEVAIFPEGIKKIWQEAFQGSPRLKEVVIPSSIEFIAYQAFADCDNLIKATIPQKKMLGVPRAFQRSVNIHEIYIPELDKTTGMKEIIDILGGCVLTVQRVENGTADEDTKIAYEEIERQGWLTDVKEMM